MSAARPDRPNVGPDDPGATGLVLSLPGGHSVYLRRRLSGGQSHSVFECAWDNAYGERVVLKLAGDGADSQLVQEEAALRWVRRYAGPEVPAVLHATTTFGGRRCLILQWLHGSPPTNAPQWRRFGQALATLHRLPAANCRLPRLGLSQLLKEHRRTLGRLEAQGAPIWLRAPRPPHVPAGVTHGDPGPGNVLDDGARAQLIDFETAAIRPIGLDLARAVLSARLAVGEDAAAALLAGYGDAKWATDDPGWLVIAAVQLAGWRLAQPGRRDTWPQVIGCIEPLVRAAGKRN